MGSSAFVFGTDLLGVLIGQVDPTGYYWGMLPPTMDHAHLLGWTLVAPIVVLTIAVVVWDLLVRLNNIPPYVLPGPILVLDTLLRVVLGTGLRVARTGGDARRTIDVAERNRAGRRWRPRAW